MVLAVDHAYHHHHTRSAFQKTEVMKKEIAFFDFDGTITTKDTYLEFIKFSKGTLRFLTGFMLYSPLLVGYVLKLVPNQLMKEKVFRYYFKNTPLDRFQEWCDAFATQKVPALIRPKALEELKKLQQSGTTVVIVSASFGNWIQKWASDNNFQLIATKPQVQNGRLTGAIDGKNCHGDEKVRRIRENYALQQYDTIYAYGDTSGDKPMLALATTAVYKPFRS
jgi:HAD superfamily hydrolase (TIGR01490 family)